MEMIIYLASLFISIMTFEVFLIKKVNNRDNRLLPAIICDMTLYELCRLFSVVRPESVDVIKVLEDFALLQLVYLIIPYMWDFYTIEWSALVRTLLLLIVIITDAYILLAELIHFNYEFLFMTTIVAGFFLDLGIWVSIFRRRGRTNEENFYHKYFGAAVFFTMFGVVVRLISPFVGNYIIPILMSISCFMVIYAIEEDYLVDQEDIVTDNLFDKSDLILIILDNECSFSRANNTAIELLPEFIDELTVDPNNH
ncbi:MAG: hypothetical protein IJT81_08870, partial [Lachnospiraceae bacterium]|nr:hypothetical protein [Lachnospiraceae bacterium]